MLALIVGSAFLTFMMFGPFVFWFIVYLIVREIGERTR